MAVDPTSIKLKIAVPADAAAMSYIHAHAWQDSYKGLLPQDYLDGITDDRWIKMITSGLETGSMQGWLLFVDERAAACACAGKSRAANYEDDLELISIYCLSDYWGIGCGHALFQVVTAYAKEHGFKRIVL